VLVGLLGRLIHQQLNLSTELIPRRSAGERDIEKQSFAGRSIFVDTGSDGVALDQVVARPARTQ
jgi:hypothetical protein